MTEGAYVAGMGCIVHGGIGCAAFHAHLREPRIEPSRIDLEHGHQGLLFALDDSLDLEQRLRALGLSSALEARLTGLGKRGSLTLQASLLAAAEAWAAANLEAGEDIGLILAGNNLDPLAGYGAARDFALEDFAAPTRAMTWLDGHLLGALAEAFGITGPGVQVGGSSAAGLIGTYQALVNMRADIAGTWLVVAPPMVLSPVEWSAFANVGALAGLDDEGTETQARYAPFDASRRGFVPGHGAAALVLKRDDGQAGVVIAGGSVRMDAHARMEPDSEGEARAMQAALADARLTPSDIDYVNAHGSGSIAGDQCEAEAVRRVFGEGGPAINATKGLVGHCLTSAGLVEIVATCLQMSGEYLHGNAALDTPLRADLDFVGRHSVERPIRHAVCNSFAFGGVNASMALSCRRSDSE